MTSLATAQGTNQMAGIMSPALYSTKMLVKFFDQAVVANVTNTDWEGEIKQMGHKVVVRTQPAVTIRDLVKNGAMTMENIEPGTIELDINKGNYFYGKVDSVDQFQSDINFMEKFTEQASLNQKVYVDTDFLSSTYADAASFNKGSKAGFRTQSFDLGVTGTPRSITTTAGATDIVQFIVDCAAVLDEAKAPNEDRWMVLPMWAIAYLKNSSLRDAHLTGDAKSQLRTGKIGMVDRFEIYGSNLVSYVDDVAAGKRCFHAIAGHRSAVTFATQMLDIVYFDKLEQQNGKAVRGTQVYGYKTFKSDMLLDMYISKG